MIIAIDGPAASGKGTISKALAKHYQLPFLDTGLLYRAVGNSLLSQLQYTELQDTELQDAELQDADLEKLAESAAIDIDPTNLDSKILEAPEIAMAASKIARFPKVRAVLFNVQRDFALQKGGAVLDGRDIGTRICPEADVKIFVQASAKVRAKRRAEQLRELGKKISEEKIMRQIITRDENDRSNPAGAFFPAKDAHLLDTSELDIEGSLKAAIAIVEKTVPRD